MQSEIRVFFANTETLSDERQQRLFDMLPVIQKLKANQLKSQKKKREFIVGRTLLIQALHGKKNLQNLPSILEKPSAAPTVSGLDHCYVSISHSGYLVCCVLHEYPIGIDIEYKKNRKNLLEKSDFFMSYEEMAELKKIAEENPRIGYFYDVWCAKEAFYKALDSSTQKQTSLKSIRLSCFIKAQWSLFQSEIDNYHLALVYRGEQRLVQLTCVNLESYLLHVDTNQHGD